MTTIAEISEVATELATLTDKLNEVLARVEQALKDARFGVAAEVLLDETDDRADRDVLLHFCKSGSEWGIFLSRLIEQRQLIPLLKGSRRERVLAAKRFTALFDALLQAALDEREGVQDAIAESEWFIGKLNAP